MAPGVVVAFVALALLAGACSDDDEAVPSSTTAPGPVADRPPPPDREPPPPFESSIEPVTAEELHASWRPGCPLPVDQLRRVRLTHFGFDHEVHDGQLVVAAELAEYVVAIFAELYEAAVEIERMEPVDVYDGSDEASMDANNTSAFNCRRATGGTGWSEHAYGRAIDVNPLQNPYVRGETVLPPQSARYADRSILDQGVIVADSPLVYAFVRHGWVWGGTWTGLKDYQHFSPSGR